MFTKEQVERIWENGNCVPNFDPGVYRKDHYGAWIRRFDYHEDFTPLSFGWLAVPIVPLAQGGEDDPCNLRPLQWESVSAALPGGAARS